MVTQAEVSTAVDKALRNNGVNLHGPELTRVAAELTGFFNDSVSAAVDEVAEATSADAPSSTGADAPTGDAPASS